MAQDNMVKAYWMLTYFKDTGKYYSSAVVEWEVHRMDNGDAYANDAIKYVRHMLRAGSPLPGLIGTWTGPVMLQQCVLLDDTQPEPRRADDGSMCCDYFRPDSFPTLMQVMANKPWSLIHVVVR